MSEQEGHLRDEYRKLTFIQGSHMTRSRIADSLSLITCLRSSSCRVKQFLLSITQFVTFWSKRGERMRKTHRPHFPWEAKNPKIDGASTMAAMTAGGDMLWSLFRPYLYAADSPQPDRFHPPCLYPYTTQNSAYHWKRINCADTLNSRTRTFTALSARVLRSVFLRSQKKWQRLLGVCLTCPQ